jgi:copper chaperone CopZ
MAHHRVIEGPNTLKEARMLFSKTKEAKLRVAGMSCGHCEKAVEKGLAGVAGIAKVRADHEAGAVTLRYKGDPPDLAAVRAKVTELGYEPAEAWS